jgi:hypothetical protein
MGPSLEIREKVRQTKHVWVAQQSTHFTVGAGGDSVHNFYLQYTLKKNFTKKVF